MEIQILLIQRLGSCIAHSNLSSHRSPGNLCSPQFIQSPLHENVEYCPDKRAIGTLRNLFEDRNRLDSNAKRMLVECGTKQTTPTCLRRRYERTVLLSRLDHEELTSRFQNERNVEAKLRLSESRPRIFLCLTSK
jgi:hypothetical protein